MSRTEIIHPLCICFHLPVNDAVDEGVDLDLGREFGGAGVVAVTQWMDDYD